MGNFGLLFPLKEADFCLPNITRIFGSKANNKLKLKLLSSKTMSTESFAEPRKNSSNFTVSGCTQKMSGRGTGGKKNSILLMIL